MERAGRNGTGWATRLLLAVALLVVGAAAATWGLARSESAARFLGVVQNEPAAESAAEPQPIQPLEPQAAPAPAQATVPDAAVAEQIVDLQSRIRRIENETEEAQGSVGRADALLIAFAARRAVERGAALGYLEPLLVNRFGADHPQAVAAIVTTSRTPVRLADLVGRYQELESELLGPAPDEDLWTGFKRGLSSLISIRQSDTPSSRPEARYERAKAHLMAGEVDAAVAETMRLPGAARARDWVNRARRYVAVHRALDEIESAALIRRSAPPQAI